MLKKQNLQTRVAVLPSMIGHGRRKSARHCRAGQTTLGISSVKNGELIMVDLNRDEADLAGKNCRWFGFVASYQCANIMPRASCVLVGVTAP